ncbi:hypothetical protein [Sphingomonas sp. 10B4]|uniref:hypothetical protein n=1 Tax=Sphingomonas sp. 10B4 TaxID=3048575 RepID=UPI002AB3E1D8|nr:hypothetical protein [Sphingomonas sp. 10B4]MDY7525486.1 hypothetical protein [Sphingomonas sp. 10B4]MEB0281430.1 hypothetical protein [Sphingomonas sp. 10B4]
MDEKPKDDVKSKIAGCGCLLVITLVAAAWIGSGSSSNVATNNSIDAAETIDGNTLALTTPPAAQSHNYTEESKGIYYYVGAVSENAKAQGVAAGQVSGFKFYGTTDDDQYILGLVDDNGRTVGKAFCNDPCVIVRPTIGEKFGAKDTIIGAAFQDAITGQMKKYKP